MGIFFTAASAESINNVVLDALSEPPPGNPEALKKKASDLARRADSAKEKTPRLPAFIGAAILLVVLMVAMIYTGGQVDAQNPPLEDSQLKATAEALRTAFTGLLGAIIGFITGEAMSK